MLQPSTSTLLVCFAILMITTASIGIHYQRSCDTWKPHAYGVGGKLSSPLYLFLTFMLLFASCFVVYKLEIFQKLYMLFFSKLNNSNNTPSVELTQRSI